jgi:DNA-binding HxlR family transcriptional regulator
MAIPAAAAGLIALALGRHKTRCVTKLAAARLCGSGLLEDGPHSSQEDNRMLPRTYDNQVCSIARALEVLGERWTLLVLRDAFRRVRRFEDFQRNLGVARNVLTDRLNRLVEEGILERVPYQERPVRFEYRLTDKGIELWPVIMTLLQWGDRYYADPNGPPLVIRHKDCGGELTDHLMCTKCGAELGPRDVRAEPGTGAVAAAA